MNWRCKNYVRNSDGGGLIPVCDNFSTDEKLVGTWIDGRPVYRKAYSLGSSSGSVAVIDANFGDRDLLFAYGHVRISNDNIQSIPNNITAISIAGVNLVFGTNNQASWSGGVIIVHYVYKL